MDSKLYRLIFTFIILDLGGSDIIPSVNDLCASFQHSATTHLCKKIHRGMIYADMVIETFTTNAQYPKSLPIILDSSLTPYSEEVNPPESSKIRKTLVTSQSNSRRSFHLGLNPCLILLCRLFPAEWLATIISPEA